MGRQIIGEKLVINIINTPQGILLSETYGRPIVYLDHWGFNEIALNKSYRKLFCEIMNRRKGILRISVYNIRELVNQSDNSQREQIYSLIDEVDTGYINIHPREVINKENNIIRGLTPIINPSVELEIFSSYLASKNYATDYKISEIVQVSVDNWNRAEMSADSENFVAKITNRIDSIRNNTKEIEKAKKRFIATKARGPKYQAATREIASLAVDFVIMNKTMKMTKHSEWSDIFHLIVPVAYCDFVLLDRRWKNFIEQTGLKPPKIAYTFDKRTLTNFFSALETYSFD